jgi:hypothetical protein
MAVLRREGGIPNVMSLRPLHVHGAFILMRRLMESDADQLFKLVEDSRKELDIIVGPSGYEWDDLKRIRVRASTLRDLCMYVLTSRGQAVVVREGVKVRPSSYLAVAYDDPAMAFDIPPDGLIWLIQGQESRNPLWKGRIPAVHVVMEFIGAAPGERKHGSALTLCGQRRHLFSCQEPWQREAIEVARVWAREKTLEDTINERYCHRCRGMVRSRLNAMEIDYGQTPGLFNPRKGRTPSRQRSESA